MTLEIVAVSDVGLVRDNNEDIAVVGRTFIRDGSMATTESTEGGDALLLGVADGVGGANAGEIASRYVIEQLAGRINTLDSELDAEAVEEALRAACLDAHNGLTRKGFLSPRYSGMATTATVLFYYGESWYVVHAGDSRFYLGSGESFQRLSRDHTLREFTGDSRIPGNILVNCFGTHDEFFVDFFSVAADCRSGDLFLLCSDGLSDMVDDETIWQLLSPAEDLAVAASDLLELAKTGGGRDNITFVAARVQ